MPPFIFRRALILPFIVLICVSHVQAQWRFLNPRPSMHSNRKVVFTDRLNGYILNTNGDLFHTPNQGGVWNYRANYPNLLAMDIKDSTGVMAGYLGTLYVSATNGQTWEAVTTRINDAFKAINIVSRDTILLLGSRVSNANATYLYRSVDRGKTWTTIVTNINANCFYFVNSKLGFLGGAMSAINKTTDGGLTWTLIRSSNSFPSTILNMRFFTADSGLASMEHSTLLRTVDGGKTWQSRDTNFGMPVMSFLNSMEGYVAGSDGFMGFTADGGATVTRLNSWGAGYDQMDVNSLHFLTRDTGFVVGLQGRIGKTNNGGTTWSSYTANHGSVRDLHFPTPSTGYAAFYDTLYKTKDFGATWQRLPFQFENFPTYGKANFEKVYFTSADTGIVMTSNPTIVYRTVNGGESWSYAIPGQYTYERVDKLQFLDKKIGFASLYTYYGGSIVKTIDGGNTWRAVWSAQYMGENFTKICYLNQDTGFAIRNDVIYRTIDGSRTWQVYNLPVSMSWPTNIYFTDRLRGFITDEASNIARTTDGGATWVKSTLPGYASNGITTINFLNQRVGYLTTSNGAPEYNYGAVYRTIDSGRTWAMETNVGGTKISYSPDGSVYVSGGAGTIITTRAFGETILPVKISGFAADISGSDVILSWQAGSDETGSFELERSFNGRNFDLIKTRKFIPETKSYQEKDADVLKSNLSVVYYRLKTVHADHRFEYSPVLKVEKTGDGKLLSVYPNPANNSTTIGFRHSLKDPKLSIYNAEGRMVQSIQLSGNIISYNLSTAGFLRGIYRVVAQAGREQFSTTLVIGR